MDNYLYVLDKNVVRRISLDSNGDISDVESIAGQPGKGYYENNSSISIFDSCPGYYALFKDPSDFAVDKQGNIFITDKKGFVVWKVSNM